jgi:hypothetical protein
VTSESDKISSDEMIKLFGETMPIEAISLLWNSPGEVTIGEVRARLRQMARSRMKQSKYSIDTTVNMETSYIFTVVRHHG